MNQNTAVADRNPGALNLPVATAIGGTDITAGQGRAAFLPTSMGEAMEIAKLMAAGNFVPPHLRNKPGDCLAVVMQSARWGMDPFAVASKSYFVNDRMAYEAQLVNAVVNSSNVLDGRLKIEWSGEGVNLKCFVSGRIKGDPDIKTREVKLATIKVRNSPLWQADPEQQIGYFATRAWARLHAPEVLLGVYTPDEIESIPGNRVDANAPQRLSSDMLAQQAGVTVEQQQIAQADHTEQPRDMVEDATVEQIDTVEAEIEDIDDEMPGALSEAAQRTLDEIDGALDVDQADDEPDPREAIAADIIAKVDKCATVIDLQQLRSREATNIDALPDEMAARVKLAFKAMHDALQRRPDQ
ncbi:MAG: recombinase RecT [Allorhizobium sp.]